MRWIINDIKLGHSVGYCSWLS